MSILTSKNVCLMRMLGVHKSAIRYTSTTGSSKGQAIGIPTSVDLTRNMDLSFEDSKTAFKAKSTLELLRGYVVFQLCSISYLVDNQKSILEITRKLIGKQLFGLLMRSTFYGHFVAGQDKNDIRGNVEKMMKYGVKSMLNYSAEGDLGGTYTPEIKSSSKSKYFNPSEAQSDNNKRIFLDCIDAVSGKKNQNSFLIKPEWYKQYVVYKDVTNATGIAQAKVTSMVRPALLLKFSTFVKLVRKSTTNISSLFAWKPLINKSDHEFAHVFNGVKGIGQYEQFSESELGELRNMLLRLDEIVEHAAKNNVRVYLDAEQTYFNDAIRQLILELMRHFNKEKCVVSGTYQNYLKNAYDTLKSDIEESIKDNFCFGAKLVRGAYIDQERQRAKQVGYTDPINDSYEATTRMYEKSLLYCLEQISRHEKGRMSIMVASHNEDTIKFAVQKMQEYKINPTDHVIRFGQLLGMCDYISFYLGGIGYSVYKAVPYGPVDEVLPYLSRRANENRGIFEKVKKEKRLLLTELKRRFLEFN